MKQNMAENNKLLVTESDNSTKSTVTSAPNHREFAKELRALGQEIEKFSFSAFDLQIDSGIYVVSGEPVSRWNT
jgi:hypothetical protein